MKDLRKVEAEEIWPLNWSARLSKDCTDIMFFIAVNDVKSILCRIEQARRSLDTLEAHVKNYQNNRT